MKKNEQSIRILHCVGHMKKAGAETFIMNMYRSIDRSRAQFDFLCCERIAGDYDDEIKTLGGKIFYLDDDIHMAKGRPAKYWRRVLRFKKAFKDHREDEIVHIHGHHAFDIFIIVIAARMAGVRNIVVHSHNAYAESHIRLHKICRLFLAVMKTRQLACSDLAAEWMFVNKKYTVVPNGIDVEKFIFDDEMRQMYRKEFGISDGYVIGHVGRFEEQKNHVLLIDIFSAFLKEHKNSWLLLIGEGFLKDKIKARAEDLGISERVIFAGVREDVSKIYSAMDIFIFPSLFEGLGIAAIEAEASDLPCLFSDMLPGDVDLSDKVTRRGIKQPIEEWVKALERCRFLADTTERRNNLNLIREKGFDTKDSCKRLFDIYMELV